jgi:hypothetical protein
MRDVTGILREEQLPGWTGLEIQLLRVNALSSQRIQHHKLMLELWPGHIEVDSHVVTGVRLDGYVEIFLFQVVTKARNSVHRAVAIFEIKIRRSKAPIGLVVDIHCHFEDGVIEPIALLFDLANRDRQSFHLG